jgi:PAS domain S-box-containing protein
VTAEVLAQHLDSIERRAHTLRTRATAAAPAELVDEALAALDVAAVALRSAREALASNNSELGSNGRRPWHQTLAEESAIGIFHTDAAGQCVFVNQRFCDMAGLERSEALGTGWSKAVHPDDRKPLGVLLSRLTREQRADQVEFRLQRPDGVTVWVLAQAVPERDAAGGVIGFVGTVTDITERKCTEDALRRSEARFRRLFDANIIGVLFWNADGGIPDANDAFLQMVGYTRDDLVAGRVRWKDMTPPEYAHLDLRGLEQIAATGVCDTFEKEYIHKDGRRLPIAISGASLDDTGRTGVSFVFDLSERKRAEQALAAANAELEARVSERTAELVHANQRLRDELRQRQDTEAMLREQRDFVATVLDTIDALVVVVDREGRILRRSLACDAVDGCTFEQVQGKRIWETAETDEEVRLSRTLFDAILESETPMQFETDAIRNGRRYVIAWSSCVLRDAGRVRCVVSAGIDVTERKLAEESLRTSEARFQRAFDGASIGMALVALDGRALQINRALCDMLGYSEEELLPKPVRDLMHPDDFESARADLQRLVTGEAASYQAARRYFHKSGEVVWTQMSVSLVRDRDGEPLHTVSQLQDITARKYSESALAESRERYRQVSELTSDYAYAFRIEPDGRVVFEWFTGAFSRITGFASEEIRGLGSIQALIHPDDLGILLARMSRLRAGEPDVSEFRMRTKAGGYRWLRDYARPERDEQNGGLRIVGAAQDITDRKLAEAAQRASEERFQSAFLHAPIGMVVSDLGERPLQVNRALCEMLGYSEAELLAQPVRSTTHPADLIAAAEQLQQLRAGTIQAYQGERRYIHRLGHEVWAAISVSMVRDASGQPLHIVALLQNITERKRIDQALRQSEERFSNAFEHAPIGMALVGMDGTPFRINHAMCQMFGYTEEELLRIHVWELTHPDDMLDTVEHLRRMVEGEIESWHLEKRYFHKQGHLVWGLSSSSLVRAADGSPLYIISQVQDITARRHAEEARGESEERFTLAVAGANDGVWDWHIRDNRIFLSERFTAILGFAGDEPAAERERWMGRAHPDDLPKFADAMQAHLLGQTAQFSHEYRLQHKDGSYRWVLSRGLAIRDANGQAYRIAGSLTDITERKRAEEALRESEMRLRAVISSEPECVKTVSLDGRLLEMNLAGLTMVEARSAGQVVGQPVINLIHPDDRPAFQQLHERVSAGASGTLQFRIIGLCGTTRWVETHSVPLRDPRGEVVSVLSVTRDITERKRAEEKLRASEERFALAVAGANDGVWDWNIQADEVFLSPRWKAILGLGDHEISSDPQQWVGRVHPDDAPRVAAAVMAHMDGSTPHFEAEYRPRHHDGSYRWVQSRALAIRDANGQPCRMAGSLTDITARKHAEDEARQRQAELAHALRVSTLGEMAAGLAHELNQPLSAIVSYARGCVRRLQTGSVELGDLVYVIEQVATQALRAGEVLQRHRQFLRSGPPQREWVQLNTLVRAGVGFAHTGVREQAVRVRLDLADLLPRVQVDSVQIEQVVVNLVRNAFDAMQSNGGGEIWVRTVLGPNGIEVAVQDAGCGVTAGLSERIFDAFFTTKPNGLGMGLSISRSIIDAHGGRLWVTPNPDRGMTFRFVLPAPPPQVQSSEAPEISADDR